VDIHLYRKIRAAVGRSSQSGALFVKLHHCTYVGLARTIYIHGVYTIFLAGKSPNIRSYTVYIYGSGQPYAYTKTEKSRFD